jgi:hypothetical protein
LSELHEGDIVKIICPDKSDKLGLISEVADDTMIRIGKDWYDIRDCEVVVLHREVDTVTKHML